jgi:Flp pilus assembly protein TadD
MAGSYFIKRGEKVIGPMSPDALKERISDGKIRETDQVAKASTGPWKTIADVPALAKLFDPRSKRSTGNLAECEDDNGADKSSFLHKDDVLSPLMEDDDRSEDFDRPEDDKWYVKRGTKVQGPYSLYSIKVALGSGGAFGVDDLASRCDFGPWKPLGSITLLNDDEPEPPPKDAAYGDDASMGDNSPFSHQPQVLPSGVVIPRKPPPSEPGNLAECEDCGGSVSKRAKACPHCGAPTTAEHSDEPESLDDASQLPSQRQKKEKTSKTTKIRETGKANQSGLDAGVIGVLCLCGVVGLGILVAVGTGSKAETEYNKGVESAEKEDWGTAIACFTNAIQIDPDYTEAYDNRGVSYLKQGKYDEAIADLTQAIRLDPNLASTYHNRGYARSAQGEYGKYDEVEQIVQLVNVIADYTEAIRLDPDLAYAYGNRGIIYNNQGNHDHAIADFTQAIRIDPDYAAAYYNRGIAYYNQGNKAKAEADFARAKELGYEP